MSIKSKIWDWLYIPFLIAGVVLMVSACKDDDEGLSEGNGYVQFRFYKSASYNASASTSSRASGNQLDSLREARKARIVLTSSDYTFTQTVVLNAYDDTNAEYGLRSDKLEMNTGTYTVVGFYLYNKLEEQIYTGQPSETTTFVVTSGGMTVQDLLVDATGRGTVKFTLVKNILESRAATSDTEPFLFSSIDNIDIRVQNVNTNIEQTFEHLEVEYEEDFAGTGDGYLTSTGQIDSLIVCEAGTYRILSYTGYNRNNRAITYFDDEVLQETTFTVTDNAQTDAEVPINMVETAANILDYYALKAIWEAMDGENWSYTGQTYSKGVNWNFNKDVDMWGDQPGVTLNSNGRVSTLSLGVFGPKGRIPEAIGQLTELTTLELGTHNDALIASSSSSSTSVSDPLAAVKVKPTASDLESIRSDYMNKFVKHDVLDGFSDPLKLAFEKKGIYDNSASLSGRISTKDVSWGDLTNGITGISAAIGYLTELEVLYIANAPITSLPEADDEGPGMAGLVSCTDLEIYNCPNLTEYPKVINTLPELIQLNIAMNKQWSADEIYEGVYDLAYQEGIKDGGPTVQILYLGYNNMEELPDNMSNMTKLGQLDCIYNSLTYLPALGSNVNLVQAYFDHNKISEIRKINGIFCGMEDVETFSCTYNKLTEMPDIFDASSIYTMSEVDFSFNEIASFENGESFKGINASTVSLEGNRLTAFPGVLIRSGSPISQLNLAANLISTFTDDDVNGDKAYYLESLDLSYNRITELPDDFNGRTFPYMYGLSLDGNQLTAFPWGAANISYLGVLSVRSQRDDAGNRIYTEWPTNIYQHVGLYALFLGGNDIGMVPETETLSYNIYYLDVSDNPELVLNVSSICAYIEAGLFYLFYDRTQDIRGCDSLDLD